MGFAQIENVPFYTEHPAVYCQESEQIFMCAIWQDEGLTAARVPIRTTWPLLAQRLSLCIAVMPWE